MRIIKLALLVLLVWFTSEARAQSPAPRFRDYPVSEVYTGKTAPLVLKRADRNFKTRLRDAAHTQKPNFAGHFILTTWGCGTSCIMGALIDAKTGLVHWLNFSVCCWSNESEFKPIDVRLNSRLIVFSGARNEQEGDEGTHFYKFQNGRFIHLKSILKQNQIRG